MVGVCFKTEVKAWEQDQWSYFFSNLGIKNIWEIGNNDEFPVFQPTTRIETAAELPAHIPLIVMQPQEAQFVKGTESLIDFVHPDDAIYMFGGSHEAMTEEVLGGRVAEHYVYIPLAAHECYAFSAAYMTLWDRKTKNG